MINWCAYCQTYLGEVEPFHDFSISHGICPSCLADHGIDPPDDKVDKMRPIVEFHANLNQIGHQGDSPAARTLVDQGLSMGLRPVDILIGILQPLLYNIGRLWESQSITVAEEHRFSDFSLALIDVLFEKAKFPKANRQCVNPDILLVNVEGNFHFLGTRVIELFLLTEGYRVYTLCPGLTNAEIVSLIDASRPRGLGISLSLPSQFETLQALDATLAAHPKTKNLLTLLGGYTIKNTQLPFTPKLPMIPCTNLTQLREALLKLPDLH